MDILIVVVAIVLVIIALIRVIATVEIKASFWLIEKTGRTTEEWGYIILWTLVSFAVGVTGLLIGARGFINGDRAVGVCGMIVFLGMVVVIYKLFKRNEKYSHDAYIEIKHYDLNGLLKGTSRRRKH